MRTSFKVAAFLLLCVACNSNNRSDNNSSENKEKAPGEVKQYAIDRFDKSSEVVMPYLM